MMPSPVWLLSDKLVNGAPPCLPGQRLRGRLDGVTFAAMHRQVFVTGATGRRLPERALAVERGRMPFA